MIELENLYKKIKEIEDRMEYIIDSWECDSRISPQEIRFVCICFICNLYKNEKIKNLARNYLERKIKRRSRLDTETLLTAMACSLVIGDNPSEYWAKIRNRIERSSGSEKYYIAKHFLVLINPNFFKKLSKDDKEYVRNLLEELEKLNLEYRLFSYNIKKNLFKEKIKNLPSTKEIKHLTEYLLWEIVNSNEYANEKHELRKKYIPEILYYKVDRIDWIILLVYQFLKKNEIYMISKIELDMKINEIVKSRIYKKVLLPVGISILFLIITLQKENILTKEIFVQIILLMIGIFLLVFKESLPSKTIKKKKITSELLAIILMTSILLWNLGISWMLNFIISVLGSIIIWYYTE